MTTAIRTHGLSKDYGLNRGLFDLDLEVEAGEVLGYLGPNGAGKTTTIRLLMGLIQPTGGRAEIFGLDCQRQAVEVKKLVGYLPGEMPLFGGLRASEVVTYLGGLRGGYDPEAVRRLAERLQLDLGRRYREFSTGNKKKLGILLAFAHEPRLLILDEPTGGLDPLNQQEFYHLVDESRQRGATVFLSSHILSEVERVCDRVGIIRSGRLVQLARLDELHHIRYHHIDVDFIGEVPVEAIRAVPGVDKVTVEGQHLSCTLQGSFERFLAAISGSQVANLVSREPSLEEVFLRFYRDEEADRAVAAAAGER